MAEKYMEAQTIVRIPIRGQRKIQKNIDAQQKAIDGKSLNASDIVLLKDTMSILDGIKRALNA